jgi:hypothetical protein
MDADWPPVSALFVWPTCTRYTSPVIDPSRTPASNSTLRHRVLPTEGNHVAIREVDGRGVAGEPWHGDVLGDEAQLGSRPLDVGIEDVRQGDLSLPYARLRAMSTPLSLAAVDNSTKSSVQSTVNGAREPQWAKESVETTPSGARRTTPTAMTRPRARAPTTTRTPRHSICPPVARTPELVVEPSRDEPPWSVHDHPATAAGSRS